MFILATLLGSFIGSAPFPSRLPTPKPVRTTPAGRGLASGGVVPATSAGQPARVPVFCYHHIQPKPNNYISITPDLLEQHLLALRDRGYVTLTAPEVPQWLQDPANRNRKAVCLTFDDGNITVYTKAVPLLRKYDMKATLFIYPRAIGTRGKMTRKELAEVRDLGFDIQCHSNTHDSMLRAPGESDRAFERRMMVEMERSRRWLEQITGKPVTSFAFPFGWHGKVHLDLLRQYGYRTAYTVNEGVNDATTDPLLLRRQSVFRKDDLQAFLGKLETRPLTLRAHMPADTSTVPQSPVTITALADSPCTDMTIDFKPAIIETDRTGRCSSGPYLLKPGFHTVTVNVRDGGEGPRTASWGFLAEGDPASWRHRGRFFRRLDARGRILPDMPAEPAAGPSAAAKRRRHPEASGTPGSARPGR